MKSKIPKYCFNCGNPLERERFIARYNEQTGEPVYKIKVNCQTCRDDGIVVYTDSWEDDVKEKNDLLETGPGKKDSLL